MRKISFTIAAVLLAFGICILGAVLLLPDILQAFEPRMTQAYDERYATDGTFVYYRDSGYKKVDGADPATFRSLYDKDVKGRNTIHGYWGCIAGRDKNAVFAGTTRIEELNPETTRIVMGLYLTDGNSIYYHEKPIKNADPAAFEHIIGRYATDGKHLYYEAAPIPGADLSTLNYITDKPLAGGPGVAVDVLGNFRNIDFSRKDGNYLKDAARVYFRGAAIPGADPATFRTLDVEGDQWQLTYAEDKNGYYFNGKPLSNTVSGTGEELQPGSLRLLQADRNFGWVELFYAGASVYAFNTQKETLELVFTRESAAPFSRITRGVYADDRTVYFSAAHDVWRRGKMGRSRVGTYTYLQPLHGVAPKRFIKVGTIEGPPSRKEGDIFEADGVRYFHPRFVDEGAALAFMESDGSGLAPEDYSGHALRLHMQGDVVEPLGLKPLPLEKEFSYYTEYRSFFSGRYAKLLFAFAAAFIFLGIAFTKARLKKS